MGDINHQDWDLLWDLFEQLTQSDNPDDLWPQIRDKHPDLVDELHGLMAAHQSQATVLDESANEQLQQATLKTPDEIGGYQILEALSAGGFGEVYLGQKAIDDYHHQVAIKLAPHGRYSPWVLDSFQNELAVLLQLNHPNIERLYEGGITSDKTPYLVVEFIDGQHIDQYCDHQQLGLTQRIRLFLDVCDAVAAMHQSLLIHRDIKGSNIMVDEEGTPKLLDFGLAKLVEKSDATQNQGPVLVDQFMTLAFASPEQISGERITTASDVYALGKLLYLLLCGRLPHQIDTNDPELAKNIIHQAPAPKASDNINQQAKIATIEPQLKSQLSGEVDAILSKAIKRKPGERYASARELREDLSRYLSHQPVSARPDTILYRSWKFFQRHTLGVISSLVFVVALLALTAMLFKRSEDLATALAITESEKQRANQVTGFLIDVFKGADPLQHNQAQIDIKELLNEASQQLALFDEQPRTQQLLYQTLGQIYLNMSEINQAGKMLDKAESINTSHTTEEQLSWLLVKLAWLDNQGQLQEASALIDQFTTNLNLDQIPPALGLKLALSQGQIEYKLDRLDTAINTLNSATKRWPVSGEVAQIEADITQLLGNIHWKMGKLDQVEPFYQKSHDSNLARLGPAHHLTLQSRSALGILAYALGQYETALAHFRPVLSMRQERLGDDHFLTADAHNRLGAVFYEQGQFEQAEQHYNQALGGYEVSHLSHSIKYTRVLNNLGLIKRHQQQYASASELFHQALKIQRQRLGKEHPDLASMLNNLGLTAYDQNQTERALEWFEKAHDLQSRANLTNNANIAYSMTNMARMLIMVGRLDEARSWIDQALLLRSSKLGESHLLYADTLMAQAEWAEATNDKPLALSLAQKALAIRTGQLPENDWRLADTRLMIESFQASQPTAQMACDHETLKRRFGPNHPRTKRATDRLGQPGTTPCERPDRLSQTK